MPRRQLFGFGQHHRHTLLKREQRFLGGIGGHADHQVIHQLHGPLDDVEMAQGHRIEGAGIQAGKLLFRRCGGGHSPSPTSAMGSTDTTRSPSSTRNTVTPWAARPWMEMPETATRMVWPESEISIRSSLSSTGKEPITALFFLPMPMATMPEPPRPVTRYSYELLRLPKPVCDMVSTNCSRALSPA